MKYDRYGHSRDLDLEVSRLFPINLSHESLTQRLCTALIGYTKDEIHGNAKWRLESFGAARTHETHLPGLAFELGQAHSSQVFNTACVLQPLPFYFHALPLLADNCSH